MTDLGKKIIDWLWDYEDENEEDFNACGYDEIETDEEALEVIKEIIEIDGEEYFHDAEMEHGIFTEEEINEILKFQNEKHQKGR